MTGTQEPAEAEARLDALRRRLYRPDATDADRRRYDEARAALLETAEDAPPAPPGPEARPPAPPKRRRRLAIGVGTVVAVSALALGVRLAQPGPDPEPARPTATPVLQQDADDSRSFLVDTSGVSEPTAVSTWIQGDAVAGRQFEGHGSAVIPVDLLPDSTDGGRAMVVLTAAQSAPTAWRALRVVTRSDRLPYPLVLAQGSADPGTIVATPSTFVYPGAPPSRIAVDAPEDVRWTLVVAATARIAPALH